MCHLLQTSKVTGMRTFSFLTHHHEVHQDKF